METSTIEINVTRSILLNRRVEILAAIDALNNELDLLDRFIEQSNFVFLDSKLNHDSEKQTKRGYIDWSEIVTKQLELQNRFLRTADIIEAQFPDLPEDMKETYKRNLSGALNRLVNRKIVITQDRGGKGYYYGLPHFNITQNVKTEEDNEDDPF